MTILKKDILGQLAELRKYTDTSKQYVIDNAWKAELKQIVKTYIDENSPFISQIDNLDFTVAHHGEPTLEYFLEYYNHAKDSASILVFHIIQFIENNDIKKHGNYFSQLSESWSITLFGIIALSWGSFCFWIGSWTNQNTVDSEKIMLKRKIDSLTTIPSFTKTNSRPHMNTDSSVSKTQNVKQQ